MFAHRLPLAPESAFGKYGKQVSSEARGSAKSVESCIAACSCIAHDVSEIGPAELWAFLQKLLDGANLFDITTAAASCDTLRKKVRMIFTMKLLSAQ